MKKGMAGILCWFGMKLILTIVACVILRWGMTEQEVEAGAQSVDDAQLNAEWVSKLQVAKTTNQIIVVSVDGTDAVLSMYIKDDSNNWEEILQTEAYIGKRGIGKVREGDNKTPVGKFTFTKAFGVLKDPGTALDYVQVDESHYWVDDVSSTYYNQLVSTNEVEKDWESAEHLCEYGVLYNYVLAINYNEDCVPGVGSAVFLHCTSERAKPTAGCVAIPEAHMKEILQKIEKDCVLIIDTAETVVKY